MRSKEFPTLLNRQAKILFNLTRTDLGLMGGSFLTLSWLGVTGLSCLVVNLLILVAFKIYMQNTPRGFLKELVTKDELEWQYGISKTQKEVRGE